MAHWQFARTDVPCGEEDGGWLSAAPIPYELEPAPIRLSSSRDENTEGDIEGFEGRKDKGGEHEGADKEGERSRRFLR